MARASVTGRAPVAAIWARLGLTGAGEANLVIIPYYVNNTLRVITAGFAPPRLSARPRWNG